MNQVVTLEKVNKAQLITRNVVMLLSKFTHNKYTYVARYVRYDWTRNCLIFTPTELLTADLFELVSNVGNMRVNNTRRAEKGDVEIFLDESETQPMVAESTPITSVFPYAAIKRQGKILEVDLSTCVDERKKTAWQDALHISHVSTRKLYTATTHKAEVVFVERTTTGDRITFLLDRPLNSSGTASVEFSPGALPENPNSIIMATRDFNTGNRIYTRSTEIKEDFIACLQQDFPECQDIKVDLDRAVVQFVGAHRSRLEKLQWLLGQDIHEILFEEGDEAHVYLCRRPVLARAVFFSPSAMDTERTWAGWGLLALASLYSPALSKRTHSAPRAREPMNRAASERVKDPTPK